MLSKPSSTTSKPKVHWTTKASKDLKKLKVFLEVKGLQETYENFNPSEHQVVSSSSAGQGSQDGSGNFPQENSDNDRDEPDHPDDSDDDDDSSGDDFPYGDFNSDDFMVINVRCDFCHPRTLTSFDTWQFRVRRHWKLSSIDIMIKHKTSINPSILTFYKGGRSLFKAQSFLVNGIHEGNTITASLFLRGGAIPRIRNNFNRKEEAIRKLGKKVEKLIKKTEGHDEEVGQTPFPMTLNLLTEEMRSRMSQVKNRLNEGEPIIKSILSHLTDDQLKSLQDVHKQTQHTISEQKVIDTATICLTDLNVLQDYIQHLGQLRIEMMCLFAQAYAKEYHKETGNNIQFSNEGFKADVKEVLDLRVGGRRALEARGSPDLPQNEEVDASRCVVM